MNTDANTSALLSRSYRCIAAVLCVAAAGAGGPVSAAADGARGMAPGTGIPAEAPAALPPVVPAAPPLAQPPLTPPGAPGAQPAAAPATTPPRRPRIGLVLSGGGARGLSHIGVLKVLEELHVPVDFIAATSMGSIVGGLYASGMSVSELDHTVRSIDWTAMFSDMPPRQDLSLRRKEYTAQFPLPFELGVRGSEVQVFRGAIAGANLELWLHDRTRQDDNLGSFDELPIPFRAVATDMVTGQQAVFRHGPLYEAIRASMSVPGLFSPAEIGDHIYGDGGLVNNLPVDVVQAMGADVVIAINIGTPLMTRSQLSSVLGLTAQSINILTEQNVREQLARLRAGDVLIEPDLGDLTFLDFSSGPKFIDLGEAAARKAADRLRPLALSPEAYAAYVAARPVVQAMAVPDVNFVQIDGTKNINPEAIAAKMDGLVGKPLDVDALTTDISSLYGSGDFDRIEYRTIDVDGRPGLRFNVSENSLGPNYLRFGLNLSTDLQGESQFNAVAGYQATWLNKWGLEWTTELELGTVRRITSELYQPLGPGSPWFTSLYGEAEREPIYLFDDEGKRLAEYSLLRVPAGLDFGYAFSRYGAIRLGYSFTHYRADLAVGSPEFGGGETSESGIALLASFDQLDNPYFPRSGLKANVEAFTGHQTFDGESNGNVGRARVDFLQAVPLDDKSQLQFAGRFAWTTNNDASLATDYQLGGFLNISGLKLDQLNGDYLGLLRGVYTYRMGSLPTIVGRGWYLGGSAEIGNTWPERNLVSFGDTRKAGSVFLGLDTYLGPFYIAYGRASGGASSWYIFLGRP